MKFCKALLGGGTLFAALAGVSFDALAAFGLSATSNDFTVDTGAGLVFKVQRVKIARAGIGDISSLVYQGVELQGQSKGSHIASGFGGLYDGVTAIDVQAENVDADHIKLTVATGELRHYYLVRRDDPTIYMGTYITAEPLVGEFRWITRLQGTRLFNTPVESNLVGNTGAIESSDVFGMADGTTRSKYFGNQRNIEYAVRGVTGNNVGVFMAFDNREGSSGGPFYRDIQNQSGTDTEVYNYMNSGHNQTEAWRMGFHGPYALVFTDGGTPAMPDMDWVGAMGLTGYVPASARGSLAVDAIGGRDPHFPYTVGLANAEAQYWGAADPVDGHMSKSGIKPGSYTMTVYKGELGVETRTVTVAAGATTAVGSLTVTGDPQATPALWRIGDWDGSPKEFLNGDKVNAMHPSDIRMSSWSPGDYLVGTSTPATGFPAYQWKDVNGNLTVRFNLRASQRSLAATYKIRIGLTAAYNGARPVLRVNGWTSSIPASSSQPKSRSLTVGSYRGNNASFVYTVPASELLVGQNVLTISPASGTAGTGFLSPGYAIDALDFVKTP